MDAERGRKKRFAKALRDALLSKGNMSFRAAADLTDIPSTSIYNWSRGGYPDTDQVVRQLADGIGIPRRTLLEHTPYGYTEDDKRHDYEHYGIGSPPDRASHGKTEAEQSEIYKALLSFGGRVDVLKAVNVKVGKPEQALFLYHCTGQEGLEGFNEGRMYAFVEPGEPYEVEIGKYVLVEAGEQWDIRVYRGPGTGRVLAVMAGELLLNQIRVPEVLIQ